MKRQPIVYRAISFGHPVTIRPELRETEPCHADMLRYDGAFMHPLDPSLIIFPLLKTPRGKMPDTITVARWRSFSIKLITYTDFNQRYDSVDSPPELANGYIANLEEWVTYIHPVPRYTLERQTMKEYLAANPKTSIVGWREL